MENQLLPQSYEIRSRPGCTITAWDGRLPCRTRCNHWPVSATGSCRRRRNSVLMSWSVARMRFLTVLRPMTKAPFLRDRVQKCGRVESWRGSPSGHTLVCIQGFPLRAQLAVSVAPFPAPSTSHAACGFPALRAPAHFASRVMGPIMLERLSAADSALGSQQRPRASHTTTADSTASSRSPGAGGPSTGVAESSAQPSVE